MNTMIAIVRSIKATLVGALGLTATARPHPKRAKLAGRNGYGNDDIPPRP